MKTFYSHLDDSPYVGSTNSLFIKRFGMTEVHDPKDADVIIWNGGEDIGTSIYNERPASHGQRASPSRRDLEEIAMFELYKGKKNKLLFGICRGSQLLNCLNGGTLYQDVNGHGGSHDMYCFRTHEVLEVTSTHHQQMRINPHGGELIGVANKSTRKVSDADGRQSFELAAETKDGVDVEIVWYQNTHTLCMQGHPEYVPNSAFATYTLKLLQQCWADIHRTAL